jgi:hypothetical protein
LAAIRALAYEAEPAEQVLLSPRELGKVSVKQIVRILKPHEGLEWLPPATGALEDDAIALPSNGCGVVYQLRIVSMHVSIEQGGHFPTCRTFQYEWTEENYLMVKVRVDPLVAVNVVLTAATRAGQSENGVAVFGCVNRYSRRYVNLDLRHRNVAVEFDARQLCCPSDEPGDATRWVASEVTGLIHPQAFLCRTM